MSTDHSFPEAKSKTHFHVSALRTVPSKRVKRVSPGLLNATNIFRSDGDRGWCGHRALYCVRLKEALRVSDGGFELHEADRVHSFAQSTQQ